MPEKRVTRRRGRRTAGLKAHEVALLSGEPVAGCNPFARTLMHRPPPNAAQLEARLAMLERHADLIPEDRRPVVERYAAAWRGEIGPGEIRDPSRWWRAAEAD